MPERNCWYVSYAVKSDRDPRRYARVTRTFDSEEHAKLFVREIAADHLRLAAGTINPHSPKRVVSAAEIAGWLETPLQFPVSGHAVSQARPEKRSSEAEQARQVRAAIQKQQTPAR
jgi:hypothetical protein